MKIALLADFPLHILPELGEKCRPKGHWATWLPQLAGEFGNVPEMTFHWLILSDRVQEERIIPYLGQTFHVLPTTNRGRALSIFSADRKRINQRLQEIKPDLVHGWGTEDVYGLAAVLSGFTNLVSMQGILSYYVLQNRMDRRVYLQALFEMFTLWKANLISTESAWGKKVILRRFRKAGVKLVEYGVQEIFLETTWHPDPAQPVVIFVGSVTPRKGIQDLLEAFRCNKLQKVELWIVGGDDSPWAQALRAAAGENVKWFGRKTPEETAALLSQAWCLALPTRADTSPNVVKEARVIGLPVITSPHGGQTTYIHEGETGYLVEPKDVGRLRQRLIEVTTDFPLTRRLGACQHVEQRELLTATRTAVEFLKIYREMLNIQPN